MSFAKILLFYSIPAVSQSSATAATNKPGRAYLDALHEDMATGNLQVGDAFLVGHEIADWNRREREGERERLVTKAEGAANSPSTRYIYKIPVEPLF